MYSQFAKEIRQDLANNLGEYLVCKCIGIFSKLQFQARNTLHYNVLLFLEVDLDEDVDTINKIVSAELPTGE